MNGCWTIPAGVPALAADRLQVWRICLGTAVLAEPKLRILLDESYAVLNVAERDRASRMRAGEPREEFIAARGCLRRLLGTALGADPRTLMFENGPNGKPFLRSQPDSEAVEFNVAHSHGIILIALSKVGAIGIDVECIDSGVDLLDVARTAFHAEELSRVRLSANPDDAQTAFYGCWTRKEAILKADGRGLSLEPTSFVAGVDSVTEQEVVLGGKLSFHAFYVRELDVGLTHRAAIATTAAGYSPKCYEFAL